jgi:hypothetical protein
VNQLFPLPAYVIITFRFESTKRALSTLTGNTNGVVGIFLRPTMGYKRSKPEANYFHEAQWWCIKHLLEHFCSLGTSFGFDFNLDEMDEWVAYGIKLNLKSDLQELVPQVVILSGTFFCRWTAYTTIIVWFAVRHILLFVFEFTQADVSTVGLYWNFSIDRKL